MNPYFNNSEILIILYKRRKNLMMVALIAIVLSAIFSSSLFIKPKFKSSAILYPANVSSYSIESSTEQMLQILEAEDIMDSVVKKLNLGSHYKIEKQSPLYRTYIKDKFHDNVSIQKTQFESVEIVVYDTDPKMAYNIVKSIVQFYDKKIMRMHREKDKEILTVALNRYESKSKQVDSLTSALQEIKIKYGILEYDVQAKEAMRGYIRQLASTGGKNQEIVQMIKNLTEKGEEFVTIKNSLNSARGNLENLKTEYENVLKEVTKEITFSTMVTHPVIADKKSYPVRWLIVLAGTVSAVFFAFLFFLYNDSSMLRIKLDESTNREE